MDREERSSTGTTRRAVRREPDEAIGKRLGEVARVREVNEAIANSGDAAPVTRECASSRRRGAGVRSRGRRSATAAARSPRVIVLHDVTRLRSSRDPQRVRVERSHEMKTPSPPSRVSRRSSTTRIEPDRGHRFGPDPRAARSAFAPRRPPGRSRASVERVDGGGPESTCARRERVGRTFAQGGGKRLAIET